MTQIGETHLASRIIEEKKEYDLKIDASSDPEILKKLLILESIELIPLDRPGLLESLVLDIKVAQEYC